MPECPVCELIFPVVLPDFCSRCAWDIKNDPLFIISLDPIPADYLEAWRQRRELARNLWKEREEFEAKASEQRFWKACQERHTTEACNEYQQKCPNGIYILEARGLIELIRQEQERNAEKQFWHEHCQTPNISGYENYLKKYPQGIYAEDAKKFIQQVEKQKAQQSEKEKLEKDKSTQEQAIWNICKAKRNASTIQNYIDRYPNGRFVAEARELLITIQAEQRQQDDKLEKERASQAQAGREKQIQQPKREWRKRIKKWVEVLVVEEQLESEGSLDREHIIESIIIILIIISFYFAFYLALVHQELDNAANYFFWITILLLPLIFVGLKYFYIFFKFVTLFLLGAGIWFELAPTHWPWWLNLAGFLVALVVFRLITYFIFSPLRVVNIFFLLGAGIWFQLTPTHWPKWYYIVGFLAASVVFRLIISFKFPKFKDWFGSSLDS